MDAVGFHDIEECFLADPSSFSKELVLRICSGGGDGCSRSCDFGGFGGGGMVVVALVALMIFKTSHTSRSLTRRRI